MPGVFWLIVFVVIPGHYAVVAIALGREYFLYAPIPYWNPLHWNPGYVSEAFSGAVPGGEYWPAVRNTIVFVGVSLGLCFAIGFIRWPITWRATPSAQRRC